MRSITRLVAAAAIAAVLTVSCGAANAPAATKRTIYMTALEYKGSTEVVKEPFPTSKLPEGGGYLRKAPADGKWETSTYRWEPGTIVVYQGDEVELFTAFGFDDPDCAVCRANDEVGCIGG